MRHRRAAAVRTLLLRRASLTRVAANDNIVHPSHHPTPPFHSPSLRPADLPIAVQIFRKHCKNPVLSIIDIRTDRGDEEDGLPVKSYFPVATVDEARRVTEWTFKHIPSEIGAYQAEEVGVEHLLRDINGRRPSPLAKQIKDRVEGLAGLKSRLVDMAEYLDMVLDEGNGMTVNNAIIFNMQNMLNLLPNISMESLLRAVFLKTNDMHLVMYLASLIRSITALHDLVTNKIRYVSGEVDAPLLTKKKETSAAADADAPAAAAAATK